MLEEDPSQIYVTQTTQHCGKSPQEINNIVHKVNDAGRRRLLKFNARKTKLMVVGDENANVSIDVDEETIDKVNSFKYLGAIKTSTGSCSEDVKARIGRAKKAEGHGHIWETGKMVTCLPNQPQTSSSC